MGLKLLIDEIKAGTDKDIAQIRAETKRQQQQIVDEASARAVQIVEEARKQGSGVVAREQVQIATADLRAKKIVADAKNKLLQQVYDEVGESLPGVAKDARYPKLFKKLSEDAIGQLGSDAVLHCNKGDLALAKKYGKAVGDLDCAGGVLVVSADGLIRVNNTFEALLEDSGDEIRQKAYSALFASESGPAASFSVQEKKEPEGAKSSKPAAAAKPEPEQVRPRVSKPAVKKAVRRVSTALKKK